MYYLRASVCHFPAIRASHAAPTMMAILREPLRLALRSPPSRTIRGTRRWRSGEEARASPAESGAGAPSPPSPPPPPLPSKPPKKCAPRQDPKAAPHPVFPLQNLPSRQGGSSSSSRSENQMFLLAAQTSHHEAAEQQQQQKPPPSSLPPIFCPPKAGQPTHPTTLRRP